MNCTSKLLSVALGAALGFSCLGALAGCAQTAGTDAPAANSEAAQANGLEKTDFTVGYLNSTAHLLAFVAAEEGFFADEGLSVALTQFNSAAELESGLETGKLDVALIGSVPTLTFCSSGAPLSIFGGAMSNGHGYVIKPQYTEGKTGWDVSILRDRNVASVKNSVQDEELQELLAANDLPIGEGDGEVHVQYFDSQKDAYAALANDSIDAASVYSPYASLAKEAGYEVVYYCSDEPLFENQPCCRQVALTEALAERPHAYTAFERAIIKAYQFSQTDHEKTVQDVKKYIDIDEELIDTEIYGGYSTSYPDPDYQGTKALKDSVVALGYTADFNLDDHFDVGIYEQALADLTAQTPDDAVLPELNEHFEQYQ